MGNTALKPNAEINQRTSPYLFFNIFCFDNLIMDRRILFWWIKSFAWFFFFCFFLKICSMKTNTIEYDGFENTWVNNGNQHLVSILYPSDRKNHDSYVPKNTHKKQNISVNNDLYKTFSLNNIWFSIEFIFSINFFGHFMHSIVDVKLKTKYKNSIQAKILFRLWWWISWYNIVVLFFGFWTKCVG